MRRTARAAGTLLLASALAVGACGDDDVDSAAQRAEEGAERVKDEAAEGAEDAFATFRTGFERLIDEASSGDSESKERLLDECRDSLERLRKDNDPRADRVGALCEKIRNTDDGNTWKEIREEYDQLKDS
jgi:hypothetical protein